MENEKMALSVTETARALGVSRPTVYRLLQRADFPSFRVGSRQLVSRQGLEDWVSREVQNATKN